MKIGIAGAGIAGMLSAWYLSRGGAEVTVFESKTMAAGASSVAAGMLTPPNELEFGETDVLRAGQASLQLFEALEKDLGDIRLGRAGMIEAGLTTDDMAWLKRFYAYQQEQGLQVEWLTPSKLQELEPAVSPKIPGAVFSPGDLTVDPVFLLTKVREALEAGGKFRLEENTPVKNITVSGGKPAVTTAGGEFIFDHVIIATGTGNIPGLEQQLPIIPVRGEIIWLKAPDFPFLERTVRVRNRTMGMAYIVPRDKLVILGSTSEEKGFNPVNTAGGLMDILRKSWAAVPGIYELDVVKIMSGLRPSTYSRKPVIDQSSIPNVWNINGLYRHGILLGPVCAKGMADLILSGKRNPEIDTFVAESS